MNDIHVENEVKLNVVETRVLGGRTRPGNILSLGSRLAQHVSGRVETPGGTANLRLESADAVAGATS